MPAKKVVIVTGTASGIGKSVMHEMQSRGWLVGGMDLQESGSDFDVVADVSDYNAVAAGVAAIEESLGSVTAAVTAAGHYQIIQLVEISDEKFDRMLHVHLGGAFNMARAELPGMTECKTGAIVHVTSELAIGGGDQDSHYASAKGAIIGFIRSLAAEFAPHGIRVNGVAPGPTDTPLLAADSPWRDPNYISTLPSRSLCTPEEVALTVGFLLEDADFIVGEIISPNSGAVI